MWIIASGIALAGVVVFAVNGLEGIPGEWAASRSARFSAPQPSVSATPSSRRLRPPP